MVSKQKIKTIGMLIPILLEGEVEGWRNMGWSGVTQTTAELLSYWFEEDREGAKFHLCQQQAIETIIYCHEILGVQNPYQLYQKFSSDSSKVAELSRSKVLQDELNPINFPKYCLKMATGSGKTWVLNALMIWHYFNALNDERPGLFSNRFLIVTPGKEVQKRILEAVRLGGDADINKSLFMPSGARWRNRFYFELYEPSDFRENLTLTDDAFVVVTNWQQFRFANDDPSLWEELVGEREEIPKAEIIADLLTEYPDICVLNDEAHHVHANKKPNPKTKKNEELIWRRFMTFLQQQQLERHQDDEYRVFQQIDFSATPFFGSGDKKDYFPHIVYNYELAQASKDMLVKQIFLEQRQGTNLEELDFKAVREPTEGRKRGKILNLSPGQKVMLKIGQSKLEQLTEEFAVEGIERKPVMLVLAEETEVADLVAEHFNSEADTDGNYYDENRVVVYHSNLKTAEYKEAEEKLQDIDKDDKPLQVVVSVLSVREGFDRSNICVIVMLRASEADLLLEQIVGRGLRLMFPAYKPEYDQIQDLKLEAREQLLNQEAPGNAFDCLFLVEHPKFKDFYDNYLKEQGYAIASGDSSDTKSAGDLTPVDADVEKISKYNLSWAVQLFDDAPIPNLNEIDVNKLGCYERMFDFVKQYSSKTTITDVHVETKTKASTWELENEYFDYSYLLQKIARTVTQTRKTKHLTSLSAEIAALADEYISRQLFRKTIDFTDPENYVVFQGVAGQKIIDFIVSQIRVGISDASDDIQYQPGAVWRNLADVPRLLMREKNMISVQRCIYPYQAVQTHKGGFERQIITKLLNPSPEVLAFAKLDRKHDLTIPWRDNRGIQRKYEPDFLVKTAEKMYLLETKGNHLISDPSTALKAKAAVSWCKSASKVPPPEDINQPQEWEYVLLLQSDFTTLEGASFKSLLPVMRQETANLVAGLEGKLGLQL